MKFVDNIILKNVKDYYINLNLKHNLKKVEYFLKFFHQIIKKKNTEMNDLISQCLNSSQAMKLFEEIDANLLDGKHKFISYVKSKISDFESNLKRINEEALDYSRLRKSSAILLGFGEKKSSREEEIFELRKRFGESFQKYMNDYLKNITDNLSNLKDLNNILLSIVKEKNYQQDMENIKNAIEFKINSELETVQNINIFLAEQLTNMVSFSGIFSSIINGLLISEKIIVNGSKVLGPVAIVVNILLLGYNIYYYNKKKKDYAKTFKDTLEDISYIKIEYERFTVTVDQRVDELIKAFKENLMK